MKPSYIKTGGAYRPCIRDDAGKVIWQSDVVCSNRDHSTSRGPSARDLAKFALEAATDPSNFQLLLTRQPPDAIRRSEWEMESWRARQQQYRWALAVAEQVKSAIAATDGPGEPQDPILRTCGECNGIGCDNCGGTGHTSD